VFDFELSDDEMKTLDSMTTPSALETFKDLYRKCVIRDTSITDGIKMDITVD
jgi:hypothetical protein